MKKIILDCDPGMDDSVAIVMAAKSPEIELLAVTTVNGNYPVDVTCANARKTLEMIGRTDIPVARGMARPMVRDSPRDPFTHGKDGQGENFLPDPVMPPSKYHAVDLIIETVKRHPREVHLVVTGPMTNIAMALIKEPELGPLVASIVAISGAFGFNEYAFLNATGDTPQSEWNVYVDPEAANIVYRSGIPFTALGLDVATHFDVNFTDREIESLRGRPNKEARFLATAIDFVRNRGFDAYCAVIDCMAVAYVIDPSLVETVRGRVGIETGNGLTLGMTVLDRRHHHAWNDLPEIAMGRHAAYDRFLRLLIDVIGV
ncbi:MAG: nucleoside hydrolase [Treponema sp.]|nr:nucleoside hydrolase [Treponema sp.]